MAAQRSEASSPTPSNLPAAASHPTAPTAPSTGPPGDEEADAEALPRPRLRLELRDLRHKSTKAFLDHFGAAEDLDNLIGKVVKILYQGSTASADRPRRGSKFHIPPTRSVTLVLRDMDGVAYTTGLDLDDDHKEIHLSLSYIAHVVTSARSSTTPAPTQTTVAVHQATSSAIPFLQPQRSPAMSESSSAAPDAIRKELLGVICHELVHCFQYNAKGTAPGGLIEGIADWVRLRAGYVPPHWKKEAGSDWDAGYQKTGYFLDWIEVTKGVGSIPTLNETLRNLVYDEDKVWTNLFGATVKDLWTEYCKTLR